MVLILYQVKKNLSYVLYFDVTTVWMGALSPINLPFQWWVLVWDLVVQRV